MSDDTRISINDGNGDELLPSMPLDEFTDAAARVTEAFGQDVQLSFDVHRHPALQHSDHALLASSLKVSGAYGLRRDLQPGEQLMVIIQSADGEVLSQADAEVSTVGFAPITDSGAVIGMERVHKAKIS